MFRSPLHLFLAHVRLVLGSAALGATLVGCAQPGVPLPPTLAIPVPVADLAASRAGAAVTLHWTMPRQDTENVPLAGPQRAVVCRALSPDTPCHPVAALSFEPRATATWVDQLPASLATGPAQLLVYTVLLENRHGHSLAPSNAAFTAAGAAPPPVQQLQAQATAAGIELHWQAAPTPQGECLVRLDRERVLAPGEQSAGASDSSQGVPQPANQVLEVRGGCARTSTTDRDAQLNRTYRYSATRVVRVSFVDSAGHTHAVELASAASAPAVLKARDLFPPSAPAHLAAVADPETRSIDLSWDPSPEADLRGYFVYRRPAAEPAAKPQRVSGDTPVPDAGWHDAHPAPGVRYLYSVSAEDTSGNESARSPEAEETLTLPETRP